MKKNKLSKLAKAGLALGALSGVSLLDAQASQNLGFSVLGSGTSVRSELIQKNLQPSPNAPIYLGSHEGDKEGEAKCGEGKDGKDGGEGKCGEGKCGEGKCGDGKDGKDGGEAKCGEGHDEGHDEGTH